MQNVKEMFFVRRSESEIEIEIEMEIEIEIEADKLCEDSGRVNRNARFSGRTLVVYDRARVWREDVKSEQGPRFE